jgi:hypothetical protein
MSHQVQNPVRTALLNARLAAASPFERYCYQRRLAPVPAPPATVVAFVRDNAGLPIEQLWEAVQQITQSHLEIGLADPVAGPATEEISLLANIDPPNSWPKAEKERFKALPYDLQLYMVEREMQRDREVRRIQNDLAKTRQQLTALQNIVTGKADNSVTTEIKTGTDASA